MKDINLVTITRSAKQLLAVIQRFHITLIILIVLGTLIAVVANVNAILSQPPDENYRQEAQQKSLKTNFDKETIDAINQLRKRQEDASLSLPGGRNNPFAE